MSEDDTLSWEAWWRTRCASLHSEEVLAGYMRMGPRYQLVGLSDSVLDRRLSGDALLAYTDRYECIPTRLGEPNHDLKAVILEQASCCAWPWCRDDLGMSDAPWDPSEDVVLTDLDRQMIARLGAAPGPRYRIYERIGRQMLEHGELTMREFYLLLRWLSVQLLGVEG